MAFVASKVRARRAPEPVGRGLPIVPSYALELWYKKKLSAMTKAMIAEYKEQIAKEVKSEEGKRFYATDAIFSDSFNFVLKSLQQRWSRIFEGFAATLAPEFVEKVDGQATSATLHSLSIAGLKAPVATYNRDVANTLKASVDFNHTLITGLGEEVHDKIYKSVMLSLTSPDPEQQGQSGIQAALKAAGEKSKERIDLITRDQTSKLYNALSDARMEENGVDEFEWLHSSAGKTPRHSHVEKDGMVFKVNDPRLWEGPKADQGPPGWAINCRCRRVPIIR